MRSEEAAEGRGHEGGGRDAGRPGQSEGRGEQVDEDEADGEQRRPGAVSPGEECGDEDHDGDDGSGR